MTKESWSLARGRLDTESVGGVDWLARPFSELDTAILYRVLALRSAVFVVEQECMYQDMDGLDTQALTVVGIRAWGAASFADASRFDVMATARIMPPGLDGFDDPSISRLCVSPSYRQYGFGRILLAQSIKACRQLYPQQPIRMSAQAHLQKFFRDAGFETVSDVYLQDHIPHVEMVLMPPVSVNPAVD